MASVLEAQAADPAGNPPRFDWRLLTGFWLIVSAVYVVRNILTAATVPLLADTDDAMRMVVVRDFMNGQGWWDHIETRLNTPYGAEIHWSRLVDTPIALLIDLFRPVAGANAETLAVYVWPLVLLFGLLALTARLTVRLAGPDAMLPGLALPVFSTAIMVEFAPGRIDHHSVQTLFALVLVLATIEAWQKPRWAILAGLAGGFGLAIGTEGLPFLVAAIIAFGLYWSAHPGRAGAMRDFGLAFGGATLVSLAIHLPPGQWFRPACDALSFTYASAAVGVGLVFALLSVLPMRRSGWPARLGAGVLGGGVLIAVLVAMFPQCLGGPYAALDPWLKHIWLDRITEARPIWQSIPALPGYTLGVALPPLLALPVIAWRVWRGEHENRVEWMVSGLFLGFAVLVMVIEIRGARLAAAFAVPAGAWLITMARQRYLLSARRLLAGLGLVGAWLAFCGIALGVGVNAALLATNTMPNAIVSEEVDPAHSRAGCRMPAAFAQLEALPAARIMAPTDLSPHILLYTHHSVVGAPYHRNQAGLIDTINFFNRPIDSVRDILTRRGISLVVNCPYLPEMQGAFDPDPGSFVDLSGRNALPSWLKPISPPDAVLQVYRVEPPASGAQATPTGQETPVPLSPQ